MAELTQEKVVEIMRGERFVMLTSVTEEGQLHSHPMTPQEVTEDGDVWFFIGLQGEQAQDLKNNPTVNVAFAETGSWLSVSGEVEFVQDQSKRDELWNEGVSVWFDGGKDDPHLGLIRFISESAQFWGQPGGTMAALASIVKSRVTGEKPSGTSQTVQL